MSKKDPLKTLDKIEARQARQYSPLAVTIAISVALIVIFTIGLVFTHK